MANKSFDQLFNEVFGTKKPVLRESDPKVAEIQAQIDAEYERQRRAEGRRTYLEHTVTPRKLSEATLPDGSFQSIV